MVTASVSAWPVTVEKVEQPYLQQLTPFQCMPCIELENENVIYFGLCPDHANQAK